MKVYIVVGEWHGVVNDVEVYQVEERAEERKRKLIKEYGEGEIETATSTVQVFPREVE